MATNALLSPFNVFQAIQEAKRRGGPSDYYGLGAAMRGVGNDWDAMQRTMGNTLDLQRKEAEVNAKLDSGFYPAQAERDVAAFNLGSFDSKATLESQREISNAFKQAMAEGKRPGTPEFTMAMQNYITNPMAATRMAKDVQAAQSQLQNRALQVAVVKKGAEDEIAKKFADQYYKDHEAQFVAFAVSQGDPPAVALQGLKKNADTYGKQKMQELGLQIEVDPFTGMVTARDAQGQNVQLDPSVLASGFAMTGNTAAFKALQDMTRSQWLMSATPSTAAAPTKESKPGKPVPTPKDEMLKSLLKERADLRKTLASAYAKGIKEGEKVNTEAIEKLIKEVEGEISRLGGKQAEATSGVTGANNNEPDIAAVGTALGSMAAPKEGTSGVTGTWDEPGAAVEEVVSPEEDMFGVSQFGAP